MRSRRRSLLIASIAVGLLAAALGPAVALSRPQAQPAPVVHPGLTRIATVGAPAQDAILGIATFDSVPTGSTIDALRAAGLTAQGMRHLPMAFVIGTADQLAAAVDAGVANDVYPDEQLEYHSVESNESIRAAVAHSVGVTGKGVGVAIVDSGVDATHPALADHVTHNMKVLGPEYVGTFGIPVDPRMPPGTIMIPVDQGPYNNSDLGSGHGTHVSGIVAGDGTDSPEVVGVAPDAEIIGYSTGDVALITTIVASYDDILAHHEEWNIDVVNNSWGSGFRLFDPNEPINLATKAVHDAGLVISFSAGNDTEDGTINPYSVAPWVISVAAGTVGHQRSDFTSGGLQFDNSQLLAFPEDKHLHFEGDRTGMYHPDVTGPGTNIVSAGTPFGAYVGPTEPGGATPASGTSMSAPHIAGLAALLLQARPDLTPAEVRAVLQVTSTPLADGTPFWQAGYGYVDAGAAVAYVQNPGFNRGALDAAKPQREARVKADRDFRVLSGDQWQFTPLPVTFGGLDSVSYEVAVGPATEALALTVAFPTTPLIGINGFEYSATVLDADGNEVGVTEVSDTAGVSSLFVDLRSVKTAPKRGTWTVTVAGLTGASDTNFLIGNTVSVSLAQLKSQPRVGVTGPTFHATGTLPMYFNASPDASEPFTSPEGCAMSPEPPAAPMSTTKSKGDDCHAGTGGYTMNYGAGIPASFTTAPLKKAHLVGGPATLTTFVADTAQPAWSAGFLSNLTYTVNVIKGDDTVRAIATGSFDAIIGADITKGVYAIDLPVTQLNPGQRLQVALQWSGFYTSSMRVLFGGGEVADAGISFSTGVIG